MRLQGGTQVEVTLHSSALWRPPGEVGMADFSSKNQTPHLENVQQREGLLQIVRTSDVENVSEQLQLDLHYQVLVVLQIMITLPQWRILPSSSP